MNTSLTDQEEAYIKDELIRFSREYEGDKFTSTFADEFIENKEVSLSKVNDLSFIVRDDGYVELVEVRRGSIELQYRVVPIEAGRNFLEKRGYAGQYYKKLSQSVEEERKRINEREEELSIQREANQISKTNIWINVAISVITAFATSMVTVKVADITSNNNRMKEVQSNIDLLEQKEKANSERIQILLQKVDSLESTVRFLKADTMLIKP
ncbi:MAG: hypothetical protein AAF944_04150 [Bacteroidota bacterium]